MILELINLIKSILTSDCFLTFARGLMYFITICCADRQCIFGQITEQEMTLNQFGQIAYNEWLNTINLRNNRLPS